MIINDCYIPLLDNKSRLLIMYGGGSSGKSVFAAQKIISRIKSEKSHKFLCLRKVASTVKDSIFAELKSVIYTEGYENEFKINKSDHSFLHLPSGNEIICKGLDEPEKIKSIQGITGMWLEEVTEFTEEDLDQLRIRIRGKKENYVQYIYTFNPISEDNHVVDKYIVKENYNKENVTVFKSTYKDNHFLTDEDRQVLEDYKDTNKLFYDVYCLGVPGVVDKTNKFFFNYDEDNHLDECVDLKHLPIKLSFDFNIEPFATIVYQTPDKNTVNVLEEIKLNDSDIEQMCDHIKANYSGRALQVTGDKSGGARTGVVRGKTSYWRVIKRELKLSEHQMRLRAKNLDLLSSRILCNMALRSKDITINAKCENLANDCKFALVDDKGILIKDRKKNKMDFGDCFRYALDCEFPTLHLLK